MGRIRRWLRGTFRADRFEADEVDAGSVNTDDAAVTNPPTEDDDVLRWQEGAETGTVTADGVDNSGGDNGWGQFKFNRSSVVFDNAFKSTPNIAGIDNGDVSAVNSGEYKVLVNNASTTGFDFDALQMAPNDNSGTLDAYAMDYVAMEGR